VSESTCGEDSLSSETITEALLVKLGLSLENADHYNYIFKARNVVEHLGVEFSPVYSVMGSVISQEIVSYYESTFFVSHKKYFV
jgi:hypothetical protein